MACLFCSLCALVRCSLCCLSSSCLLFSSASFLISSALCKHFLKGIVSRDCCSQICFDHMCDYGGSHKRKQNFPHIRIGKFRWEDGIGCKVIYEEGLPNIWGNAHILSPYMRRSLVIYPDPSEFPNIWGTFYSPFLSVSSPLHICYDALVARFIHSSHTRTSCRMPLHVCFSSSYKYANYRHKKGKLTVEETAII